MHYFITITYRTIQVLENNTVMELQIYSVGHTIQLQYNAK